MYKFDKRIYFDAQNLVKGELKLTAICKSVITESEGKCVWHHHVEYDGLVFK